MKLECSLLIDAVFMIGGYVPNPFIIIYHIIRVLFNSYFIFIAVSYFIQFILWSISLVPALLIKHGLMDLLYQLHLNAQLPCSDVFPVLASVAVA